MTVCGIDDAQAFLPSQSAQWRCERKLRSIEDKSNQCILADSCASDVVKGDLE
jgi:hypothetical protein